MPIRLILTLSLIMMGSLAAYGQTVTLRCAHVIDQETILEFNRQDSVYEQKCRDALSRSIYFYDQTYYPFETSFMPVYGGKAVKTIPVLYCFKSLNHSYIQFDLDAKDRGTLESALASSKRHYDNDEIHSLATQHLIRVKQRIATRYCTKLDSNYCNNLSGYENSNACRMISMNLNY